MVNTKYYNLERQLIPGEHGAAYMIEIYENPVQYEESDTSIADWDRTGVSIRQSNVKLCHGGISPGFFAGDTSSEASVIFMLYFLSTAREMRITKTLVGFALTNDLRIEPDTEFDNETLYIDAICTNSDIRHIPVVGIRGAGTIIMNAIEEYAIESEYTSIKLSALPYVIGYYRRLGYRHVNNCRELDISREGLVREKDRDILAAASEVANMRFPTDEKLDYALKTELAKANKILSPLGQRGDREKLEYLASNLNSYFKADGIGFIIDDANNPPRIVAQNSTGTSFVDDSTLQYITELIYRDNRPILDLLDILRRKGFSVACNETDMRQASSMRHNVRRDSDGDIELHCLSEGFTMRKCLFPQSVQGAGYIERGRNTQKIYNRNIQKMSRRRKKRRTTRNNNNNNNVPWTGWRKQAPNAREKTTMKRRCGKKCFLGPGKSFPVCVKNTCRVSKKGAWAAFVRSRAWGKPRKAYRGKAKPQYSQKIYKQVERKANRIIKRKNT